MEPFINFVIRPPRADYTAGDLLEPEFSLKGCGYQRKDVEILNSRGHVLQCSHYMPISLPPDAKLPCVIYCHGNSGCRADGNEAAVVLLPLNITVFTLDFSGSGLSDGDFVSLGWNEKDDLKAVVAYLWSLKHISCIGLWGRSMGAVTSLLYGAEDPSIAGMVLDSPFSNLFNLMMELVDVYKIRLPKFTIRVALKIMRRIIQKRAQFDIMDMDIAQHASKTFIPALFGHALGDVFIPPHHSDLIHREYAGDKNIIKFEGDHNSSRPQFYYDSVAIFFYNILCPPTHVHAEKSRNRMVQTLPSSQEIFEQSVSQPVNEPVQDLETAKGKMIISQQTTPNELDETNLQENLANIRDVIQLHRRENCSENSSEEPLVEFGDTEQNGDCSYPSSNGVSTEGWGRCSSHGISEKSADVSPVQRNSADIPLSDNDEKEMILRAMSAFKDVDLSNARKLFEDEDCSLITPRRKSRLDALSRKLSMFRLGCFRGTEDIRNET